MACRTHARLPAQQKIAADEQQVKSLQDNIAGQERILWFTLPVFEYHRRHAHPWSERIGARGRATMHEHLRRVLADVIANVLETEHRRGRHGANNIPADLLSKYLAATFVLVLDWWMDNGTSLPPKEVNDLFLRLLSPAVTAFFAVKL